MFMRLNGTDVTPTTRAPGKFFWNITGPWMRWFSLILLRITKHNGPKSHHQHHHRTRMKLLPPKKTHVLGPNRGGFHHFSSSTFVRNTSRSILRIVSVVLALVWAQGKKLPGEIWLGSQGKRRPRTIEVGRKIGKKTVDVFLKLWSHVSHQYIQMFDVDPILHT